MPLRSPAGFISAFFDPLKNPDAPTSPAATAGDTTASVSFTAPANVGGSAITAYYAVANTGATGTAASSPVSVTGLTNGTSYTFNVWALNSYGPGVWSAATGSVTPSAPLAVFAGGSSSGAASSYMSYVTITTTGNSTFWGYLTTNGSYNGAGIGSSTRAVATNTPSAGNNTINYFTFASTGNASNFGDQTSQRDNLAGFNSSTRGVFANGNSGNIIDYITIATTGNATSFGQSTVQSDSARGTSSPTRGIFTIGFENGVGASNVINYVTIATTGNASVFGDLSQTRYDVGACSNGTRGVFGGGLYVTPSVTRLNTIDYVTIATTGNATNFGQLTVARNGLVGASSSIRGLFAGGYDGSSRVNTIDYITIASAGNATSFGQLTSAINGASGCTNVNGGLQ